jgi:hypothetical protein
VTCLGSDQDDCLGLWPFGSQVELVEILQTLNPRRNGRMGRRTETQDVQQARNAVFSINRLGRKDHVLLLCALAEVLGESLPGAIGEFELNLMLGQARLERLNDLWGEV